MIDPFERVAVLTGIEAEGAALRKAVAHREEKIHSIGSVYVGDPLIIATAGPGLIAAARTTEAVIRLYSPDVILSIGTAGGLSVAMEPFDLFAASEVMQHDVDLRAMGIGWSRKTPLRRLYRPDPDWLEKLRELPSAAVKTGRLLSGSAVVGAEVLKGRPELSTELSGDAVDMETVAVATVAAAHGVPWASLRVISDLPGDQENAFPHRDFRDTIRRASRILADSLIPLTER